MGLFDAQDLVFGDGPQARNVLALPHLYLLDLLGLLVQILDDLHDFVNELLLGIDFDSLALPSLLFEVMCDAQLGLSKPGTAVRVL